MDPLPISSALPDSPNIIRFEDARRIGGYEDRAFASEADARKGWANIERKQSRTNAELWIGGKRVACHSLKK